MAFTNAATVHKYILSLRQFQSVKIYMPLKVQCGGFVWLYLQNMGEIEYMYNYVYNL